MMIKNDYHRFLEGETSNFYDKLNQVVDVVREKLPDFLHLDNFSAHDETAAQKLVTILFQLLGEVRKKKLTSLDKFYIAVVLSIYHIGLSLNYEGHEAFEENWKIFQERTCEFLNNNYLDLGLKEIELGILKLVGFASVTSQEEIDNIKNEIFNSPPEESIRSVNIPFLEVDFKLAVLLVVKVPFQQTDTNMIEDIIIDHVEKKITIEATYEELFEKNQLMGFRNRIQEELNRTKNILEKNGIFLDKVMLDARIKDFDPPLKKGQFFGRNREINRILRLSEANKIAIVTASPGVGITATLKYGIEPTLTNLGAYVIYCSVDNGFRQTILKILDQLFPDTRGENLFAQLEILSSEKHILVFILDQFEKIFTNDDSNKLKIDMLNFIKEFNKLNNDNNRLILGISDDFLGNLFQFSKEIHGLYTEQAIYILKNLDRTSAGEVIVKTIERMNLPVDEQLIDTILDDLTVREADIYSPLIHIIFSRLSKKHRARYLYGTEKNPFNYGFYENIGGAAELLLDYARERLEEFSEEEQNVCLEIISKMVTPFFTCQRVGHSEILELNDNRVDIENLLQRLHRLRLIKRIQTSGDYEYELIHDYFKGLAPMESTVPSIEDTAVFIREAVAYIDANYYKTISLQEVAKRVGVTPEYLSRQFKSEFKIGFKEYVTRKRIEEAKQLLIRFPELPINELSERTGFASPQHFINVFKSETHYTPLKFRQRSLPNLESTETANMRSH